MGRRKRTEEETNAWLRDRGWRELEDGRWVHYRLEFPWTRIDAIQVQSDADAGRRESVHLSLTENAWP